VNYTRQPERHAWALLKRSYQAEYPFVLYLTLFLGGFWRGFGGVGAVFNAQGLVCRCVNRARKFTPHARVMFLESKRAKRHMTQVWITTARCKHARTIGLRGGRGPTWPLGGITLTVVFGMLGYVLVPTTPAPRVARVGN
jgi:hypothetical protein